MQLSGHCYIQTELCSLFPPVSSLHAKTDRAKGASNVKKKERRLTKIKSISHRMSNLFINIYHNKQTLLSLICRKVYHFVFLFIPSLKLDDDCKLGGCHTRFPWWITLSQEPNHKYDCTTSRGGVRDPKIAFGLQKKNQKEKEEAWKENKGKAFHNGGSGLSWSHRQCGFHQRHAMLVPIHQLRLHVIISKVISDRGSTKEARDIFTPTSGHPGVGQVIYRGIGF